LNSMKYGYALTTHQINNQEYIVCLHLDDNRNLMGIHISNQSQKQILNHIYVGRVENIIPSIKACFVRFAQDQVCFLPLSECESPYYSKKNSKKSGLCCGDEILIQITREALKEKEPAASCNFTLQGKYMVLTTKDKSFSASSRLSVDDKNRMKALLKEQVDARENFGIVIRTIAQNASDEDLLSDFFNLQAQFRQIEETYTHKALYDEIWAEAPTYINYLKNQFRPNEEEIVTDIPQIADEINRSLPVAKESLRFYDDKVVSLSTLYHIRGNIDSLLAKKIWLKSGGNIIIEQLETLTFIDVNTAKSDKNKSNAFAINHEAMQSALRQIALRNISGMILIDFINMKPEEESALIEALKAETKKHENPCRFVDITKLGLVELTRKKVQKSIKEICQIS